MVFKKYFLGIIPAFLLLVFIPAYTSATPVGYTSYSDFIAALSGATVSTLNFESMDYGDTIASGDEVGGVTFTYDFGGVEMMVTDDWYGYYPSVSAPNLLGTDDGDVFQDGDDFTLSFASSNAIGMYFISADEMWDGDIVLSANGDSVGLDVNMSEDLGEDSSGLSWYAYFLGIIDNEAAFTTASFTTSTLVIVGYDEEENPIYDYDDGYFLYNIDDITTATFGATPVPEPATVYLFLSGLAGLFAAKRRWR